MTPDSMVIGNALWSHGERTNTASPGLVADRTTRPVSRSGSREAVSWSDRAGGTTTRPTKTSRLRGRLQPSASRAAAPRPIDQEIARGGNQW